MCSKKFTYDELNQLSYDELKHVVANCKSKEEIVSLLNNAPSDKDNMIKCLASMNKNTPVEFIKEWRNQETDYLSYMLFDQAIGERTNPNYIRTGSDPDYDDPYPGWQSMK